MVRHSQRESPEGIDFSSETFLRLWHYCRYVLPLPGFFKQLLRKCLEVSKKRQAEPELEIWF